MRIAPEQPRRRRSEREGRPFDSYLPVLKWLGLSFAEYVELLEAITRRERVERDGGELREYRSVLQRLGIGQAEWEQAVRLTSRRFSRELQIMADRYEESRRRK